MPRRSLSQSSFFDPEVVMPECLESGTAPWLLARYRTALFPPWLFTGWRGEGRLGRDAWPAVVLMTLCVMRWNEEGMSRRAACRRAKTDLQWRAALGLSCDRSPPDERTIRDFECFLRRRHPDADLPRHLLIHEHIVRLCLGAGMVDDGAVWVTDSTPMWCYGAVLDTVRLMGDGLRMLGRRWAEAMDLSLEEVAAQWGLPLLVAKSTKGSYRIDWRDSEARAELVSDLAGEVVRIVAWVRRRLQQVRSNKRKGLLRKCRRLVRVVRDDLQADERGRLVVARKVARARLVSLTDPQARHGRKSKSNVFNGFKLNVLGDSVSGLIAAVAVTPGNEHDGTPAHRLTRRAKALCEAVELLLGDTAYGGAQLRHHTRRALGVELLAPPPAGRAPTSGRLGKESFVIDIAAGVATCPQGAASKGFAYVAVPGYDVQARRFAWSTRVCGGCPVADACLGKGQRSRRLVVYPYEAERQKARDDWRRPEIREAYRARSRGEKLIGDMVRRGCRRARAWGLGAAQLQAHTIAITCNLKLLAKVMAAQGQRDGPAALAG